MLVAWKCGYCIFDLFVNVKLLIQESYGKYRFIEPHADSTSFYYRQAIYTEASFLFLILYLLIYFIQSYLLAKLHYPTSTVILLN